MSTRRRLSIFQRTARIFNVLYPLCICQFSGTGPCLISLIHITFVRPFPFCCANFRQFCRFLELMKTNRANPETLVVRCIVFAYALCSSVSGTGPLVLLTFLRRIEGDHFTMYSITVNAYIKLTCTST